MRRIRANNKYSAFYNSEHFETLKEIRDEFYRKWFTEVSTSRTLDEYTMDNLQRDGRIQGINIILKEIENRSRKQEEVC
ncbi:MAG: hypothetical protein WC346_17085 [Methanogenium sp.]|jgi:TPP-dependent pyruvate/acetoin dehydrogenase alpha subunit